MRLLIAPTGRLMKVKEINTDEKTRNRLQNIGVTEGGTITLLQSNFGDVIVKVRDCRVAMNKDVASKIAVVEI
ncbi:MAG: ferrous iron transport protein A [Clostridia bacterium]|nr:ferrous iron transport protein A [Clostridia bacterium]MDE7337132.1 ferrous iron transport protein A [Clostridia bacterium]